MEKKPLVLQLFLSYLWILVVAMILIGLYGSYMTREVYVGQMAEDLTVRARLCAPRIAELLAEGNTEAVDALCKTWGEPVQTRITAVLPDGTVVGDSQEDPAKMDNHRDRPEIRQAQRDGVGQSTRFSATTNEDRMYVAMAVPDTSSPVATVRASIPVTEVNETLATIYQRIMVAGLIALILASTVTLVWLNRHVSRPLHAMREAAERFSQGDVDRRLPNSDDDPEEISELAGALNRLADQIAQRSPTSETANKG